MGTSSVTVLNGSDEIGVYARNFPAFSEDTFEPFELNGSWFALYSPDYTSTRVMSLPECSDAGGEEPATNGFCPVEYYVPRYRDLAVTHLSNDRVYSQRKFESEAEEATQPPGYEISYGPWRSLDVGFIAGCIWGDDSSWKLEVVDLSRAAEGLISRAARFGHVQLANRTPLSEAVWLDSFPPHWDLRATIIRQETRDVRTGRLIDPYDE